MGTETPQVHSQSVPPVSCYGKERRCRAECPCDEEGVSSPRRCGRASSIQTYSAPQLNRRHIQKCEYFVKDSSNVTKTFIYLLFQAKKANLLDQNGKRREVHDDHSIIRKRKIVTLNWRPSLKGSHPLKVLGVENRLSRRYTDCTREFRSEG